MWVLAQNTAKEKLKCYQYLNSCCFFFVLVLFFIKPPTQGYCFFFLFYYSVLQYFFSIPLVLVYTLVSKAININIYVSLSLAVLKIKPSGLCRYITFCLADVLLLQIPFTKVSSWNSVYTRIVLKVEVISSTMFVYL